MRLRVRTDRWTTMFFAALGLTPACGGTVTDNTGSGGSSGAGATSGPGSGGSSSSSVSTTGAGGDLATSTTGSSSSSSGSVTVTTGVGAGGGVGTGGAGGGMPFACVNPQPIDTTGYVRCQNGSTHRPTKGTCPTSVPRPAPVTDAGTSMCTKDSDCPAKSFCGGSPQIQGFFCQPGCLMDADCEAGKICVCGDPIGICTMATCTVDADCGPGLFCSSHAPNPGCPMTSFACQTTADLCGGDADCPANQQCSVQNGRRVCQFKGCVVGRPFLVGDEDRLAPLDARSDWMASRGTPDTSLLGAAERSLLAAAWARIGQMEHASVAAFARFTLHLMSLGAPATLVEASNAALADETLHAKLAFCIASGYAGRAIGPGPIAIDDAFAACRWQDILVTTIREGCIGETVAAIEAAEALEYAEDPEVRRALTRIADDEVRHAELAWRFVGWVVARWGDEARDVARAEFARARASGIEETAVPATREERVLLAGGIVPARLRELVRSETLQRVVRTCADALLASDESPVSSSRAA